MWHELWIAFPALLRGLAVTLELSAVVIVLGSTIGYLGGLSLEYGPKPLWAAVRVYVDTLRGIPVLVLLFAVFYGLPIVGIQIGAFGAGVVALSVFAGAHMTEVVRGGIASIPRTQGDAAKAIGLQFWERLRWVILPQAVRRILPPWVNTAVELVKGSSLVSLIGVVELLLATQQVVGRTFIVIPTYTLAGLMYFVVNYGISRLGALVERRYAFLSY
ncbi:MAG: amino acid ABC transporter permease [Bacillati bacterium ANGP1]|uniref:Amino acid ABC transporter permease n=1 Tax=Candidatus Segetimicrobium genomatis TaxID=2569760 RepID=A0A537L7A6_9BACT|nr:MAG: amino acid ABC transporter permease [Terrabacteria group bacterium ANGP1]TMJ12091.1 MAG: amino acid ABC transporter permease [Terrabacteria group bacterium ANGP1]